VQPQLARELPKEALHAERDESRVHALPARRCEVGRGVRIRLGAGKDAVLVDAQEVLVAGKVLVDGDKPEMTHRSVAARKVVEPGVKGPTQGVGALCLLAGRVLVEEMLHREKPQASADATAVSPNVLLLVRWDVALVTDDVVVAVCPALLGDCAVPVE